MNRVKKGATDEAGEKNCMSGHLGDRGGFDRSADGVVIAVNGQVPDGEDLSWLWDVNFEHFEDVPVVAAGERGTDLAVRLGYAGVPHSLVHDTVAAIESCPPGRVEVVANYTAFLQLQQKLAQRG